MKLYCSATFIHFFGRLREIYQTYGTVLIFVVQLSEYLVIQQECSVLFDIIAVLLTMNDLFRLGLRLTRTVYCHVVVHGRRPTCAASL